MSTPGVYFRRPQPPRSVRVLRTDVAGFVGLSERGPVDEAVRVESFNEFEDRFGKAVPWAYLPEAVAGFFENGGQRCWVVRVADSDPQSSRTQTWTAVLGDKEFQAEATGPGYWARQLRFVVERLSPTRFNLTIQYQRGPDEFWPNLELERRLEGSNGKVSNPRFFARVLNGADEDPAWLFPDFEGDPEKAKAAERQQSRYLRISSVRTVPGAREKHFESGPHERGAYQLKRLEPKDFSSPGRGLQVLEKIDEISVLAMPDLFAAERRSRSEGWKEPMRCDRLASCHHSAGKKAPTRQEPPPDPEPEREAFDATQVQALQDELIRQCDLLRDRVAVLDMPRGIGVEEARKRREQFDTKWAALYHPWLEVPDRRGRPGDIRPVPPSGHVAGVYARVSLSPGVHKPPANEVLQGVHDVFDSLNFEEHGFLNDHQVNVIRPFEGRGIRIFGARTLSSDASWRFVNVRRLVAMIEEAIEEQTQWTVFEPQTVDLRSEVRRVVGNFLARIWREGMLDGATEADAFEVICDETTTTQYDLEKGRLICHVRLKPPAPAEFVVVRIGLSAGRIEISEPVNLYAGNF